MFFIYVYIIYVSYIYIYTCAYTYVVCVCANVYSMYMYVYIYIYICICLCRWIGGGVTPDTIWGGAGGGVNTRHRTIYIYIYINILLGDGHSLNLSIYQVGHLPTKYHCRTCHWCQMSSEMVTRLTACNIWQFVIICDSMMCNGYSIHIIYTLYIYTWIPTDICTSVYSCSIRISGTLYPRQPQQKARSKCGARVGGMG